MKRIVLIFATIVGAAVCGCAPQPQEESLEAMIARGLAVAEQQACYLAELMEEQDDDLLPRTYENDELKTANYMGWICGFYPGVLWQLYENNPTDELKTLAEKFTARVEPAKYLTDTHDLGFMLYCSYGNGYRLTLNADYKEVLTIGAASLATRYNDHIGMLKSWDGHAQWQYPVIIDNMMNLEFLVEMSRLLGEAKYKELSMTHADRAMTDFFRDDYSSYHVVSYDTLTAVPHAKQTHQGYADESAWARGQAWGLYGFTMMFRETGKVEYLEQARRIAHFICNHPNLPEDKIPYWDFDAPEIPDALRDASAGCIMASAFVELSQLDKTADAATWLAMAEAQLRSLSSPVYLAQPRTNGGFTINHCVGHCPAKNEMDVPLSYADYYYIEALLRLRAVLDSRQVR